MRFSKVSRAVSFRFYFAVTYFLPFQRASCHSPESSTFGSLNSAPKPGFSFLGRQGNWSRDPQKLITTDLQLIVNLKVEITS